MKQTRDHFRNISDPKVGILNLAGAYGEKVAEDDARFLNGIFRSAEDLEPSTPDCDVLFLYASIAPDGRIRNAPEGVRDIICASRAPVVVIAIANDVVCYLAATKGKPSGTNLVMTLDRRGDSFARFFTKLFLQMKA